MKKNVRIAKQLLKIAKQLVAKKEISAGRDITDGIKGFLDQLDVLRQFPTNAQGDAAIHQYINNAFTALFTIKNGTLQAWEDWVAQCEESVSGIVDEANQLIAQNGNLNNFSKENKEKLMVTLGFMANPKFLVTIPPGKFDINTLQQEPGMVTDGGARIPQVPSPSVDKNTQTIALKGPPSTIPGPNWLLTLPSKILRLQGNLVTIATSWGNRIISGTQLGALDLGYKSDDNPGNNPEYKRLKTTWTEISDTVLNNQKIKILAKFSQGSSMGIASKFKEIMEKLATQLGQGLSPQAQEVFKKNDKNVHIAIEGANEKIMAYFTTYRDGIKDVLNEYNGMVQQVESQGGTVDKKGNIILPNGKTASIRRRNAGFLDALKNLGNKIINGVSSFCKKLFGLDNEVKNEIKKCNDAAMEWSMSGQEITESLESTYQAIQDCVNSLEALASEQ